MSAFVVVSEHADDQAPGDFLEAVARANRGAWVRRRRAAGDGDEALWHPRSGYRTADIGPAHATQARRHEAFIARALRPAFHGRLRPGAIERRDFAAYRAVNRRLAAALAPDLASEDAVWAFDLAMIPLGAALRRVGHEGPLGLLLDSAVPAPELIDMLPWRRVFATWLGAYDLIAVQSAHDAENVRRFFEAMAFETAGRGPWRPGQVASLPLTVDVGRWRALAASEEVATRTARLARARGDGLWLLGSGRLDCTRGTIAGLEGFARFLGAEADWHERVRLFEVVRPATEWVEERDLRRRLEGLVADVNGRFATLGWSPVQYLYRALGPVERAALYRVARVLLVTPLRQGTSLLAKEFVASQRPEDPGAIVLSRFSGAAEELPGALLVNPYDAEDVAAGLRRALEMGREERQRRWRAMLARLEAWHLGECAARLRSALAAAHADKVKAAA